MLERLVVGIISRFEDFAAGETVTWIQEQGTDSAQTEGLRTQFNLTDPVNRRFNNFFLGYLLLEVSGN